MNEINFVKTEDGSTGLYSNSVQDIYHSKTGALKEAVDKFCNPVLACDFFARGYELNIADICFGIGYNSKAAINIFSDKNLNITAFDFNSDLLHISPFILDSIKNIEIKLDLLYEIIANGFKISDIIASLEKFDAFSTVEFFEPSMLSLIKFLYSNPSICTPLNGNRLKLHNIYYQYISNCKNYVKNNSKYAPFTFKYILGDARKTFSAQKEGFDVVFLDAFSIQKDPTLWTIDFLKLISASMKKDSVLLSYSKSTPFRSALLKLGFFVGKTFIDGIDFGTVASFDKKNISNLLDSFDIGLTRTRAGIVYKDSCLNLPSDIILKNRECEMKYSKLLSHTQYLKNN